MRASVRRAPAGSGPYYDPDGAFDYFDAELVRGERIGPPLRSRAKALLRGALLLIIAGGIGTVLINTADSWQRSPAYQAASQLLQDLMGRGARPDAPQLPARSTARLPPAAVPSPAPVETATALPPTVPPAGMIVQRPYTAPDPRTSADAAPASATAAEEQAAEPLPAPTVDTNDPYQVRAAAVGLHPGLSRALLTSLSPTDYRNASFAIETAFAKTPDGSVFVWPDRHQRGVAVFQVRFVRGAIAGCRRYVVEVVKDRWLTTAPPMEKCRSETPGGGATKNPQPGRGRPSGAAG